MMIASLAAVFLVFEDDLIVVLQKVGSIFS